MRRTTIFLAAGLLLAMVPSLGSSTTDAAAADGCMGANGLMNLNDADDLLKGFVRVDSRTTVQIGSGDINWNRPELGFEPARDLYSLKWVEELVREHRRTGDRRYLDRAVSIVLDFAADNPVDGGPDPDDAWYPMDAGQRTTAIACVAAVTDNTAIDAALRTHGAWAASQVDAMPAWNQAIDPHLGLLMAGCDLGVRAWREQARSGFQRLISGMITSDGVLTEQAPGYGRLVWDRWGEVEERLTACGMTPPSEIPDRRAALLDWMAWASGPDGLLTPLGDTFQTVEPPTTPGNSTEYTLSGGASGTSPSENVRLFKSGYVFGRSSWTDLANSTYWTLRFGPSRDLHGHEDHTSVTFWSNGREVLVDSGHGGYGDNAYRVALQAPESHNVLMLPDVLFQIRLPTELTRSASGPGWRFDEVRDQVYGKQNRQFVDAPRTRGVLVLPDDGTMIVQDRASRVSPGVFEQLWHLVPGAKVVEQTRSSIVARHPNGDVDIHVMQVPLPGQVLERGATTVVEGQTSPTLGWFSSADAERTPAPVVLMRRVGTQARMVTVITTSPVGADVSATVSDDPGGWTIELQGTGSEQTIGLGFDGSMQLGAPPIELRPARRCSLTAALAPTATRC